MAALRSDAGLLLSNGATVYLFESKSDKYDEPEQGDLRYDNYTLKSSNIDEWLSYTELGALEAKINGVVSSAGAAETETPGKLLFPAGTEKWVVLRVTTKLETAAGDLEFDFTFGS